MQAQLILQIQAPSIMALETPQTPQILVNVPSRQVKLCTVSVNHSHLFRGLWQALTSKMASYILCMACVGAAGAGDGSGVAGGNGGQSDGMGMHDSLQALLPRINSSVLCSTKGHSCDQFSSQN